ncbi:lysosomal proton-coupled steroid conjugate and bile acid symporter SLC46A3 isoform X2 [Mustelus asterias]
MKRLFLVEPVIALYALSGLVNFLLIQQYIYRRIWERETNSSFVENESNSSCHQNHSDPVYIKQQVVQEISSHFFMYLTLIQSIPGLIVTFILGTYSDHYGRKLSLLLPSVGALLNSLVRVVSVFATMPFPVLRSMMSKLVLPKDQGVLFAFVACLENVAGTISSTLFSSVYAATVDEFPGFSFLLAACLTIIPVCILCFLFCWRPQEGDYAGLITNENDS